MRGWEQHVDRWSKKLTFPAYVAGLLENWIDTLQTALNDVGTSLPIIPSFDDGATRGDAHLGGNSSEGRRTVTDIAVVRAKKGSKQIDRL